MGRADQILSKFQYFYQRDDGKESNLQLLVKPFGELLDITEEDLLRIMRSHFVNKSDNAGANGSEVAKKGDLDKIFTLYLQSLGGTSLLKQSNRQGSIEDHEYRERTKGLISALKGGASTKDGIKEI
jgi:hypothetical protein